MNTNKQKEYTNYAQFLRLSKLPKRKDSLASQMEDLLDVAAQLGMEDVKQWLESSTFKEWLKNTFKDSPDKNK